MQYDLIIADVRIEHLIWLQVQWKASAVFGVTFGLNTIKSTISSCSTCENFEFYCNEVYTVYTECKKTKQREEWNCVKVTSNVELNGVMNAVGTHAV